MPEAWEPPTAAARRRILRRARTIAVVGASANPARASNFVLTYLASSSTDYEIWPITPRDGEILGMTTYDSLADLPGPPDVVDVFRRESELPGVAREAVEVGARVLWMQLGLHSDEAVDIAHGAGLEVVSNRCLKIEHARFAGGLHLAGFDTGVISSPEEQGLTATVRLFEAADPLVLESGATLGPVDVAYATYGELDAERANAVLVCHALTGDAEAAVWWSTLVGPGRPVDTDRFFVVCANLLGGCQGTTGPSSVDPATGERYGLRFPLFTVRDLTTVHRALLRHLGVERLYAAIGGSLGGMQALQWALDAPEELERAAVICASAQLSAQNVGFSAVGRAAILRDPEFAAGSPNGLAVARMMAHITYLSEEGMRRKFDRARRAPGPMTLASDFEVEHYLDHQGASFLERFDALTYLYLSRTMDYFDPFAEPIAGPPSTDILLVSFDTDWRFGSEHSRWIAERLRALGASPRHVEISSPWGHDSFLMDVPDYHAVVAQLLSPPGPPPTP